MLRGMSIQSSAESRGNNRRRRNRLNAQTQGWILPPLRRLAKHLPSDEEAWEVRIRNVSRFGVGFESTEKVRVGEEHRLRIGRGPMKRARIIRIVACRELSKGTFSVGAEFVDVTGKSLAKAV
jgi:hypothetical protein